MGIKIGAAIQAVLASLQVLNSAHVFGQHEEIVAAVIGAIQVGLAVYQHSLTPEPKP